MPHRMAGNHNLTSPLDGPSEAFQGEYHKLQRENVEQQEGPP